MQQTFISGGQALINGLGLKGQVWVFLLLIFTEIIVALLIAKDDILLFGALIVLSLITLLLVNKPELALAIQFNGTLIFFYVMYKLGSEPSRMLTGSFYGILAGAYLLGGVLAVTRGSQRFKLNLIDVLFTCLFCYFFLSYFLFSTLNGFAYRKATYAPLLVIAPYWGMQLLSSDERVRDFFKYCVIVAAVLIPPSFYELFSNPIFSHYGRFSLYLFSERGDNPILFAITFAVLLIILFFQVAEEKRLRLNHLALIIPSVFLLLRSGARGPIISFLVAMIFYLFNVIGSGLKTRMYLIVLVGILIVGAYNLIPESTVTFYEHLFVLDTLSDQSNSIYERLILMELAIKEFKEHLIFGVGMGNSAGGVGYPHNAIIEVAAELGLVGLAIFLLMCFASLIKAVKCIKRAKNSRDSWLMRVSFSLFVFSFVESMFSSHMGGDTAFYGSVGLISAVAKIVEQRNRKELALCAQDYATGDQIETAVGGKTEEAKSPSSSLLFR